MGWLTPLIREEPTKRPFVRGNCAALPVVRGPEYDCKHWWSLSGLAPWDKIGVERYAEQVEGDFSADSASNPHISVARTHSASASLAVLSPVVLPDRVEQPGAVIWASGPVLGRYESTRLAALGGGRGLPGARNLRRLSVTARTPAQADPRGHHDLCQGAPGWCCARGRRGGPRVVGCSASSKFIAANALYISPGA